MLDHTSWCHIALVGLLLLQGITAPMEARQVVLDRAAVDRFVNSQLAAQKLPGLALAITRGDEVLYVQGYGQARDGLPVTPRTQFLIASVSKSFTALAVLQLVEAGRIELDAPVQRYLPNFTLADRSIAARITIRHLLNQTSGLADTGFPSYRLPQPASLAERVVSLRAARPVAPPGDTFHYTDPNYQVLARVVEVVSGQPFGAYLQRRVFAPLGMHDTFSAVSSAEAYQRATELAQGHVVAYGFPIACAELSGFLDGSSGVVTTAADLATFLVLQNNAGRANGTSLLSAQGITLLHTPPSGLKSAYGMGWFATTEQGVRVLEHNGVLSVFYTDVVLLPETGYGIALLYNSNSLASSTLAFPRIKAGLIALLAGRHPAGGGLSGLQWGAGVAALTLIGVVLGLHSLLRLPRWAQQARTKPLWRLVPGIGWTFVPAVVLGALPWLVEQGSERVFSYAQLARAMPGIALWLGLCGGLGILNGTARIWLLARRRFGSRKGCCCAL